MKTTANFLTLLALVLGVSIHAEAQTNYKIRQTMTMNGQKMETTTYVKGSRKRTEGGGFPGMGADVADVEQCDLKRNLKISDKKKMYAVEPFDDGSDATATTTSSKTKSPKSKVEKGGVVTITSNINDTGERKQMFGLTARHVKTSMSMESSPDSCAQSNMKMETDGWYVDLPEFSCPITMRPQIPQPGGGGSEGGCRDRTIFKTTGGGKTGFPLTETRKIIMEDADTTFTQTVETLEFSKATLEASLFDIPNGYTQTDNAQSLYGRPDMSAMMKNMGGDDDDDDDKPKSKSNGNQTTTPSQTPSAKKSGTIRIGVYMVTNKNGESISTTNMHMFLMGKLTGGNVEAVAVSDESGARAANCDYILTSDFTKLKQSVAGKIGGMFGKVTGGDPNALKNYEAQVDFKLVSLSDGKTVAQSKGTSKGESDVDRAAENSLSQEAAAVLKAVSK